MQNDSLKEWALKYAEMGLYVFPLIPGQKDPATAHGFKDSSNDKAQIEKWWGGCPDYNIGLATGIEYGCLVVIDLDRNHREGEDGYETLKDWQRERGGELPETWTSITGQGGYHLVYVDDEPHGSRRGLYEGVDVKGEGGYIVAPPSIHPATGKRYEWEQGPGDCKIARADSRVKEFLLGPMPEGKRAFTLPETIPEGGRTDAMIRLIGSLRAKDLTNEAITVAVQAENEARCVPPLTEQELEKTVFPALNRNWKVERPYTAERGRQSEPPKTVNYVDADVLVSADLPPVQYIIDGILPVGLGGISAKSKLGKSWLALQVAVAVARGDNFLGFKSNKRGVLYIDLENTPSLTQERLRTVLDGRDAPKNLYFAHDFNLMGEGFEEDLIKFLADKPDVKLVIIDVFQKVKRGKQMSQTDYEADYEILTKVKRIADSFNASVYNVYHDRKAVDPTDPFSNLLGSTAVMGVSDFMWMLYKEKREDKEATLAVTGRAVLDASFKLRRNGALWENLGNAAVVEETRKRLEYDRDPLVNTIRNLVRQNNGKWKGRTKEIIESSQYFKGCRLYGSSQKAGRQIQERVKDLQEYDSIYHYVTGNGSGSGEHVFELENPFKDFDSPLS